MSSSKQFQEVQKRLQSLAKRVQPARSTAVADSGVSVRNTVTSQLSSAKVVAPTTQIGDYPAYLQEAAKLHKEAGNKLCGESRWAEAIQCYQLAMEKTPTDPVLYSNRAHALLKSGDTLKALQDANYCIELLPAWERGWARKVGMHQAATCVDVSRSTSC